MDKKAYTVHDVLAAEHTLEPMVCLYCGSNEVVFSQAGDARCSDCGKWQLVESEEKEYKIWFEIEEYDPVTDTHRDCEGYLTDFIGTFDSAEEAVEMINRLCEVAKDYGKHSSGGL